MRAGTSFETVAARPPQDEGQDGFSLGDDVGDAKGKVEEAEMFLVPATKVRGAPLIATAAPSRISCTVSARSLVPSGLKRNTPSAPAKPAGLVSIAVAETLRPLHARQRRGERHRIVGQRREADRIGVEARAVAFGEGLEAAIVGRREPAALQGRQAEDARLVPHARAERLDPHADRSPPSAAPARRRAGRRRCRERTAHRPAARRRR